MADEKKQPAATPETAAPVEKKSLSQMSATERKRRYEEFRKKLGHSKLEVKGDPNKHYFWAPKNDDGELVRLDYLGYSLVKEPNAKDVMEGKAKPRIIASGLREDGTYVIGDVILMQCDMEVYEFHMLDVEERSEAQIAAAPEQFRLQAAQQGIPAFEPGRARQ